MAPASLMAPRHLLLSVTAFDVIAGYYTPPCEFVKSRIRF